MANTYKSTGKVISSTENWKRYYRARIYAHTSKAIQYPLSDGSNAAAMQTFAQQQKGDVEIDVSELRCTFSAKHYALGYPNICNLTIYNLNAKTENQIIYEGYRLVLEAGYKGNPGQIFDGEVLMCTRSKLNGTDMVLNILAMDGSSFYEFGFANFSITKGQSARTIVNNIANKAASPISLAYASPALDKITLSKGAAVHGLARQTLTDLAKSINGTWFIEGNKLHVIAYSDKAAGLPMGKQAVELNAKTGLLGNPQQQTQGITARSLLNPAIQLYGLVHISNSLITEQMVTIGSFSAGITKKWALDPEGIYRVISSDFNGDTRGNNWYTDFTAVSQAGLIPEVLSIN